MKSVIRLSVSLIFVLVSFQGLAQVHVDVGAYLKLAKYSQVSISPNGEYLAFVQDEGEVQALTIYNTADFSLFSNTNFGERISIQEFFWANNERILFYPLRNGDIYSGEIFAINIDGSDFDVLHSSWINSSGSYVSGQLGFSERTKDETWAEIIDLLPDEENYVLIQKMGYGDIGSRNAAYKMNIDTGRLRRIINSPITNGHFITDSNHEISLVGGTASNGIQELYILDKDEDWELVTTDENIEDWMRPLQYYGDEGNYIIAGFDKNGILGYSVWNPSTGSRENIFHHPQVDSDLYLSDPDSTVWVIPYHDHYPAYYYPNPQHPLAVLHQQLRKAFPDQEVEIISTSNDLSKVVIFTSSPQHPGNYIILDTTTMQYTFHLSSFPDYPTETLAPMEAFEFTARDGLPLRGYITTPLGENEFPSSLILFVHDATDDQQLTWEFHQFVQLLASQGHTVLQVNYRGSTGFGIDFEEAGQGDWGGLMQDDLTDAVNWAIENDIADSQRICIFGEGYGAFASLTGLYKEPDMFQCGIGFFGEYDLSLKRELFKQQQNVLSRDTFEEKILADTSLLEARSPVSNADKITANVMLIQGIGSEDVPLEHATRMREALENAGVELEWHVGTNRTIYSFDRIISFLNDNLAE